MKMHEFRESLDAQMRQKVADVMAAHAAAMYGGYSKLSIPDFMMPIISEPEPALEKQEPAPLDKLAFGL